MSNSIAIAKQTAKGTPATALQFFPAASLDFDTSFSVSEKTNLGDRNQTGRMTRRDEDNTIDVTGELRELLRGSVQRHIVEGLLRNEFSGIDTVINGTNITVAEVDGRWQIDDADSGLGSVVPGQFVRVFPAAAGNTTIYTGRVDTVTAARIIMAEGVTLGPLTGAVNLLGVTNTNNEQDVYFTALVETSDKDGPMFFLHTDMKIANGSLSFPGDSVDLTFQMSGGVKERVPSAAGYTRAAPVGAPLVPQEGDSEHNFGESYLSDLSIEITNPNNNRYAITQKEAYRSDNGKFAIKASVGLESEARFIDHYLNFDQISWWFACSPVGGGLYFRVDIPNARVTSASKPVSDDDQIGIVTMELTGEGYSAAARANVDHIVRVSVF